MLSYVYVCFQTVVSFCWGRHGCGILYAVPHSWWRHCKHLLILYNFSCWFVSLLLNKVHHDIVKTTIVCSRRMLEWSISSSTVLFEYRRSCIDAEFEVSHHERSHVVTAVNSTSLSLSQSSNPSFLPIPAIVGYKPVSGGLACRATPRRDETNWEIMPLNAAGWPDPITLVFSNTSPSADHSLSFYFTYRRVLQPAARRVSIIQTILSAEERVRRRTATFLLQHLLQA